MYLLDNAMFRRLCALCGQKQQEKCLYSLNGAAVVKRRHQSPIAERFSAIQIQPNMDSAAQSLHERFPPQRSKRIRSAHRENNSFLGCF